MTRSAPSAYWLTGEERCRLCLQRYSFAVERRCVQCDGPACPHCVTVLVVNDENDELLNEEAEAICAACEAAPRED